MSRASSWDSWETAFVATATILGEPLGAVAEALGPSRMRASTLIDALGSSSREMRVRALARGVSDAVVALESLRLR